MADRTPEVPKLIGDLLGLNPLEVVSSDVAMHARSLGRQDLKRLVGCCDRALQRADVRKDEEIRVALLEVLAGLLPHSAEVLERLLRSWSGAYVYEVHFSLFVVFEYIGRDSGAWDFVKQIPLLLEAYLHNVSRKTAFGAWKAGDLLGDHWKLDESVPILVRSARSARFVAGRSGALHGLVHALGRRPDVDPHAESIRDVLRVVAMSDHSDGVRVTARSILSGRHPCS